VSLSLRGAAKEEVEDFFHGLYDYCKGYHANYQGSGDDEHQGHDRHPKPRAIHCRVNHQLIASR